MNTGGERPHSRRWRRIAWQVLPVLAAVCVGLPCAVAREHASPKSDPPAFHARFSFPGFRAVASTPGVPSSSRKSASAGSPPRRQIQVSSFYEKYFLPRLEQRLSRVGVLHTWVLDGREFRTWTVQDDLVRETERQFEKGTSRAVRSYLAELSGLDVWVGNLQEEFGREAADPRDRKPGKIRYGLGISHGLPRVDIGYELTTGGDLRLTLAGAGRIDLNYGHRRQGSDSSFRIFTGYDLREAAVNYGLRLSF